MPGRGGMLPLCNMVLVTNVAPEVGEADLFGLFSYCGEVVEIDVSSDMDGESQRVLVEFSSVKAAHTALILSGTPLGDRAIKTDAVESRETLNPPPSNSELKAVVMERIATAGYSLGPAIISRAEEYDMAMMAPKIEDAKNDAAVVKKATTSAHALNETFDASKALPPQGMAEIDRDDELNARYKVNEPRSTVKDLAMAKSMSLDEKFKILEPATEAADKAATKCQLNDERYKVLEKTVAGAEKGLSMAKAGYHSLKDAEMAGDED